MHTLFRTYVVIGVGSEILKKGGTKLLHQKRGATKSGVGPEGGPGPTAAAGFRCASNTSDDPCGGLGEGTIREA